MVNIFNNLLLYFQFFTRIPINKELECSDKNFIAGTPFFPIIGLVIGVIQYCAYYVMSFSFNSQIVAIILVLISILVTGALHLDGFGDCADGFFAFKGGKDKIIEIMKDSRIGAFGCIAIVFNILLKIALIDNVIIQKIPELIVLSPIIGRFSIVFLSYIGKNAKPHGTGNLFIGKIKFKNFVATFITTLVVCYFIIGISVLILIGSAIVISLLFNKLCENKIGGLSGDTLGANNEIVEMVTFMVYVIYISLFNI